MTLAMEDSPRILGSRMRGTTSSNGLTGERMQVVTAVERREEDRLICSFLEWLLPRSSGDRLASAHLREEARHSRFDEFWALFKADGSLDWPEFEQFVRWESKFSGSARRLFDLLDDTGSGRISARTILQARREFERSTDIRHSNLEDLKKILIHHHGTLGRAWRKQFDLEQTGKCCQSVFVKACRAVGFQGDLRSTWAELTAGDIHRQANLRDLDPQADALLVKFVQALKRWHNTARDGWFAIMKAHGSHGRMCYSDFVALGTRFGFPDKDSKKIFSMLDVNLDRRVSLSEWLFLELWENRPDIGSPVTRATQSPGRESEPNSARRQNLKLTPSASAASLSSHARPSLSARAPTPTGEADSMTEFVVVLTQEEYLEYQRRLRKRHGRVSREQSVAGRRTPLPASSHQASRFSMEAWSSVSLGPPNAGLEAT